MSKITETELQRRLKKLESGLIGGGNGGTTATRTGSTWEYTNPVLYLAYADFLANLQDDGTILNQSDAQGFGFTPFNASGRLKQYRGFLWSKSMYASGDPTDYVWEDVTALGEDITLDRYYTESKMLRDYMEGPGDCSASKCQDLNFRENRVVWTRIAIGDGMPEYALWAAERYTIDEVTSEWVIFPVSSKETGTPLISFTILGRNKPELDSEQWAADVVLAMSAHTGETYYSVKELGYGSAVVIKYDNGKQYGLWKRNPETGTGHWVVPENFIDGDLIVDGTINTDKLMANSITAELLKITGTGAITPASIGAAASVYLDDGEIDALMAWTEAVNAAATANSKIVTYWQTTPPVLGCQTIDTNGVVTLLPDKTTEITCEAVTNAEWTEGFVTGDLWIDTDNENNQWRYSSAGEEWIDVTDTGIGAAMNAAVGAQGTADGKAATYFNTVEPIQGGQLDLECDPALAAVNEYVCDIYELELGDLWVDISPVSETDPSPINSMHRWSGTSWESIADIGISDAIAAAGAAQTTANGRVRTYFTAIMPGYSTAHSFYKCVDANGVVVACDAAGATQVVTDAYDDDRILELGTKDNDAFIDLVEGDLWINPSNNNQWRFDTTGGWVDVADTGIGAAIANAATAQGTVDGLVNSYYTTVEPGTAPPEGSTEIYVPEADLRVGDLWVDTTLETVTNADGTTTEVPRNDMYRWDLGWNNIRDVGILEAFIAAQEAQDTANSKVRTYWTDDGIWPGYVSMLIPATDATEEIPAVQDPAAYNDLVEGDVWIDRTNHNNQWRFDGTNWIDVVDTGIAAAQFLAAGAEALADGKVSTYYTDLEPGTIATGSDHPEFLSTDLREGDLWIDTTIDTIVDAEDVSSQVPRNHLYRYDTSGALSLWARVADMTIQEAIIAAQRAQLTADAKVMTYVSDQHAYFNYEDGLYLGPIDEGSSSTLKPLLTGFTVGDFWINTSQSRNQYRFDGVTWVDVADTRVPELLVDMAGVNGMLDGSVEVFMTGDGYAPSEASLGDIWFDYCLSRPACYLSPNTELTGTPTVYRHNGSSWEEVLEASIYLAMREAQSKVEASEVADAVNNNTTTINGAKITTGTILAQQLRLYSGTPIYDADGNIVADVDGLVPSDVGAGTTGSGNTPRLEINSDSIKVWDGTGVRVILGLID